MAHKAQIQYCESVKQRFPEYFKNKMVLDVGSMDINGNNRYLFEDCDYTGLDIGPGDNVDVICPVHQFNPGVKFDVIICTEMLEHDCYYFYSLMHMQDLLKKGGLLLITAATYGRREHGIFIREPEASPYTNNYYNNITPEFLTEWLKMEHFNPAEISIMDTDIRFYGIKRG